MKTMQMTVEESVLTKLVQAYADEGKARELLEAWRWPKGPVCPHCQNAGDQRISKLEAQNTSQSGVRKGVYFCGACRQQFTVTVGTVLERSHVPISKWLMALFLLCSSKKSLSANQIHRMIGGDLPDSLVHVSPDPLGDDARSSGRSEVNEHGGSGRDLRGSQGQA